MKKYFLFHPWFDVVFFLLPFLIAILFSFTVDRFFPGIAYPAISPLWFFIFSLIFDVGHVWGTLYRAYFHRQNRVKHMRLLCIVPMLSVLVLIVCAILSFLILKDVTVFPLYFLAWLAVFHFIKQHIGFVLLYGQKDDSPFFYNFKKFTDIFIVWFVTGVPLLYWWNHYTEITFEWFRQGEFSLMADILPALPGLWILYIIGLMVYLITQLILFLIGHRPNPLKYFYIFGTALVWYFGIVHFNSFIIFGFGNILVHGMNYYGIVIGSTMNQKKHYHELIRRFVLGFPLIFIPLSLIIISLIEEFSWDQIFWHDRGDIFGEMFYTVDFPHWMLILSVGILGSFQLTHYILDRYIWKKDFGKIYK